MTPDLRWLVYSAVLAWVMIMTASSLRSRIWTGLGLALGNRDAMPPPTPLMARADRAVANMLENLSIFAVLLLTTHVAGVAPSRVELGAELFFWARLAYFPAYLAGVTYVRTALWLVSVVGLAMIFLALL